MIYFQITMYTFKFKLFLNIFFNCFGLLRHVLNANEICNWSLLIYQISPTVLTHYRNTIYDIFGMLKPWVYWSYLLRSINQDFNLNHWGSKTYCAWNSSLMLILPSPSMKFRCRLVEVNKYRNRRITNLYTICFESQLSYSKLIEGQRLCEFLKQSQSTCLRMMGPENERYLIKILLRYYVFFHQTVHFGPHSM